MNDHLKMGLAAFVLYSMWFIVDRIDESAANWLAVILILAAITFNRQNLTDEFRRLGVI